MISAFFKTVLQKVTEIFESFGLKNRCELLKDLWIKGKLLVIRDGFLTLASLAVKYKLKQPRHTNNEIVQNSKIGAKKKSHSCVPWNHQFQTHFFIHKKFAFCVLVTWFLVISPCKFSLLHIPPCFSKDPVSIPTKIRCWVTSSREEIYFWWVIYNSIHTIINAMVKLASKLLLALSNSVHFFFTISYRWSRSLHIHFSLTGDPCHGRQDNVCSNLL